LQLGTEFYQDNDLEHGAIPEYFPDEAHEALPQYLDQPDDSLSTAQPDNSLSAVQPDDSLSTAQPDEALPPNDHIDARDQCEDPYEPDVQPEHHDLDQINSEGDRAQPCTMGWMDQDLDELHCMAHLQDAQDAMVFITALCKASLELFLLIQQSRHMISFAQPLLNDIPMMMYIATTELSNSPLNSVELSLSCTTCASIHAWPLQAPSQISMSVQGVGKIGGMIREVK